MFLAPVWTFWIVSDVFGRGREPVILGANISDPSVGVMSHFISWRSLIEFAKLMFSIETNGVPDKI